MLKINRTANKVIIIVIDIENIIVNYKHQLYIINELFHTLFMESSAEVLTDEINTFNSIEGN